MTAKVLMSAETVEIIIDSTGQLVVRCDSKTEFRIAKVKSVTTQVPANGDGGTTGTWTSTIYRRGGFGK